MWGDDRKSFFGSSVMPQYYRTAAMQEGGLFKCFNCDKTLAIKLKGNCFVQFFCPRCHAFITVKMREPVNWSKEIVEPEIKAEGTA